MSASLSADEARSLVKALQVGAVYAFSLLSLALRGRRALQGFKPLNFPTLHRCCGRQSAGPSWQAPTSTAACLPHTNGVCISQLCSSLIETRTRTRNTGVASCCGGCVCTGARAGAAQGSRSAQNGRAQGSEGLSGGGTCCRKAPPAALVPLHMWAQHTTGIRHAAAQLQSAACINRGRARPCTTQQPHHQQQQQCRPCSSQCRGCRRSCTGSGSRRSSRALGQRQQQRSCCCTCSSSSSSRRGAQPVTRGASCVAAAAAGAATSSGAAAAR